MEENKGRKGLSRQDIRHLSLVAGYIAILGASTFLLSDYKAGIVQSLMLIEFVAWLIIRDFQGLRDWVARNQSICILIRALVLITLLKFGPFPTNPDINF